MISIEPPAVPSQNVGDKPGLALIISTVIVVILSMLLGFSATKLAGGSISACLGAATGNFVVAGLIALLLSLKRAWRNSRFRTKAVLVCSVLIALSSFANIARASLNPSANIAKSINGVCPKAVGQNVLIKGAVAEADGGVTISIQLTALQKSQIDAVKFRQLATTGANQETNAMPSLKTFVKAGHRLTYKYLDKDSNVFESITIMPQNLSN